MKSTYQCEPSQKGLFFDASQRHVLERRPADVLLLAKADGSITVTSR